MNPLDTIPKRRSSTRLPKERRMKGRQVRERERQDEKGEKIRMNELNEASNRWLISPTILKSDKNKKNQ